MNTFKLAAGALAAALVVGVTGAVAADLDHGRYPGGYKRHSAYEDSRYRDIYGPAPIPHKAPRYYTAAPIPVVPPAYVYRERARDLDDDAPEPRAYAQPDRRDYDRDDDKKRYRVACVPREDIKRRLIDEGWRDLQDVELRGGVARVEARRRGETYVLKVDRCTGDIVDAQKLGRPYAYEDDRSRRPYY